MDPILGFSGPDFAKIACDLRWEEALFFCLNYWHSLISPLNFQYHLFYLPSRFQSGFILHGDTSSIYYVIMADVATLHLSSLSSPKPSDAAAVPDDGSGGGAGWSDAGVRVLPAGV